MLVLGLYKGILLPRLPLLGEEGQQVAADSQVVWRGLDNGYWLLLKMEDELIEAQGVCDVKAGDWRSGLDAYSGDRAIISRCHTHRTKAKKIQDLPEFVNEQKLYFENMQCCTLADMDFNSFESNVND